MKQDYYANYPRFLIVTDCVVFGFKDNDLKVLLVTKQTEPSKGKWCLPSAFMTESEGVDDTVKRALVSKTGLEDIYMEQVKCFGDSDRDPFARIVSVVYYALINIADYDEQLSKRNDAKWFSLSDLPELMYDQKDMIMAAYRRMRYRTMAEPVGLRMLPQLFTMNQLRKLVEAINMKPRDKRNFRKLVAEAYYIQKTDLIDKKGSKRGAALYRFNPTLYEEYLKSKL